MSYSQSLWTNKVNTRFPMQIPQSVQLCYFSANLWLVSNSQSMLKSIYEDVLHTQHVRSLIYNFKHQCGYIGRTNLKLKAKMDICLSIQPDLIAEHLIGNSIWVSFRDIFISHQQSTFHLPFESACDPIYQIQVTFSLWS